MMKFTSFLFGLALMISAGFSKDASEAGVSTSRLEAYSGGISSGAFYALTEELGDASEGYLKISFSNLIYLADYLNFFLDADWFIPGNNFGGDLGLDVSLPTSSVKPFVGVGVGAHFFDKENSFGRDLGASFTAHAGILFDITDRTQIRVRVPYHLVTNGARDQVVGLDIGIFFTSPFRKVRRLNY